MERGWMACIRNGEWKPTRQRCCRGYDDAVTVPSFVTKVTTTTATDVNGRAAVSPVLKA
jgi:hypothetical protein